jgi:hypothetical protein
MNTNEIDRVLRKVPGFVGVFAKDKIPVIRRTPAYFVFNTDTSNKPGSHWIAVAVFADRVEYFDATGREPVISNYLRRLRLPVLFNNHRIQSPHSIACGIFCCQFVLRRSSGETFCEILSSFSKNTLFNDFLLLS